MIKVFDETSGWSQKVNFVDHNNVFVGYDMDEQCCEIAGWYIGTEASYRMPPNYLGNTREGEDLSAYEFDQEFFQRWDYENTPEDEHRFDGGGVVIFKLVSAKGPDLYLHLYNNHNGYYSHGFEFGDKDSADGLKYGLL